MIIQKIGFMQGRLSEVRNGIIQCFPWDNWENEFQGANKLNLKLMEWTLDHERIFLNPILTEQGQIKINDLKKKFDIKILSVTGDCFMQMPFWKFEGFKKKQLEDDFIKILNILKKINIEIIVVPIVDNGSINDNKHQENLFNFFLGIEGLLNENKQRIAFESDKPPKEIKKFFNILKSDRFGVNYDIGNSASNGYNPTEEIGAYGDKIINVHIKDRMLKGSTVPLGQGNASFETVFSLFKKMNYKGNYILQTARSQNGQHSKVLKEYFDFVKKLLN